jgi:hypothetical protein
MVIKADKAMDLYQDLVNMAGEGGYLVKEIRRLSNRFHFCLYCFIQSDEGNAAFSNSKLVGSIINSFRQTYSV